MDSLIDRVSDLVKTINVVHPYTMWINGNKSDATTQKDYIFEDLYSECRLAAPGARLSYSLRNKLERLARADRHEVATRSREGQACLFIAAKKGNVEIVDYLIITCGANIEQKGIYEVPEDRSIHFVTPLWCAAVSGKLEVVKCLVKHGANVNASSDTGSTPVRSACFMTHLDIVKFLLEHGADIHQPNYNGGTCLINSVQSVDLCRYLIECGAPVNAQDIQSKTAIHYAIQEHRLETTKLLLEHGADPMIRSRHGDDALQTACLKGAEPVFNFIVEFVNQKSSKSGSTEPGNDQDSIDDHTRLSNGYSNERIAEAYELMGSTFLDEHYDITKALQYWHKAVDLRNSVNPPLQKTVDPAPHPGAYCGAIEFQTAEDLQRVASDLDTMRVHSLLICERILGRLHKDVIFRLMYRGAAYADSLQYQRCIDLWRYALELRIAKDELLHSEACFGTQAVVKLLVDLYERHREGVLMEQLRFEDVHGTVRLLMSHFPSILAMLSIRPVFKRQQDNFDKILKALCHLIYILNVIPKTEEERKAVQATVRELLEMNVRNSMGDTLLHLAVCRNTILQSPQYLEESNGQANFPDLGVTVLLIKCGAMINSVNSVGATPLHYATQKKNFSYGIVLLLLRRGAHIDKRAVNGATPLKLIQSHQQSYAFTGVRIDVMEHMSLQCLAAQALRRHHLTTSPECCTLPKRLLEFVALH